MEQKQWVLNALTYLKNNNIINENEYKEFLNYYQSEQLDFKNKQQDLTRMYKGDRNFINQVYNELTQEVEIVEIDEPQIKSPITEETKQIIGVMDINKNDKNYIIIRYKDNTTKILENTTNEQGSKIYEIIKQKYVDINTTKLFEEYTKSLTEVKDFDYSNKPDISYNPYYNDEQSNQLEDSEYEINDGIEETKLTQTKGKTYTKKIPGFSWISEDAAFTNILFIVFLAGISSGIVIMIILNLLLK